MLLLPSPFQKRNANVNVIYLETVNSFTGDGYLFFLGLYMCTYIHRCVYVYLFV